MGVVFRVFGRTRVLRDGVPLDLGGRKVADLLTLLLTAEGRAVPAERLADQLWRGAAPTSATTTLQGYVARLRRVLEPGRSARESQLLVREGNGYALRAPRYCVDIHALLDSATARPRADSRDEWAALERALATADGAPYEDVSDVLDLVPLIERVKEVVRTMTEDVADARLRRGDPRGARTALDPVAAAQPLRERTHLLLAEALQADGHQVDALDLLRLFRSRLVEETGLDPSAAFTELEGRILRQEPGRQAAPTAVRQPMADPSSADRVVGREQERLAMRGVGETAAGGTASAVVVTGEPGIGKTTLVRSFAEEFTNRLGGTVRSGRALEAAGQPPQWLWHQVLGGAPETSGSSDEGRPFAFATEVTRRLVRLAAERPVLVVLDDLQWADRDSLHVLRIVAESLGDTRVALALVCRDEAGTDPDVARCLVAAGRMPGARRLALGALSPAAVAELVRGVGGGTDTDEQSAHSIDEITRRSGGNPLFATELALLGSPAPSALPAGVRELVRLRAGSLEPAAQTLLAVAALAGGELPTAVALTAASLEAAAGDVAMAQSVASGMLVELPEARVAIRHDLVRETLVAELGPSRRAALHARIADALDVSPGAPLARTAIALHRSESAPGTPDAAAASACLLAAREAAARAGAREAIELSTRGLLHVTEQGADVRADLHELRSSALRRIGRVDESVEDLRALADLGRDRGDATLVARAAMASAGGGVGGFWGSIGSVWVSDEHLLEEAMTGLAELPLDLQRDLVSALAVHRAATGHDAAALADQAQPWGNARAAVAGIVTRWTPAHAEDRLARARLMFDGFRGHPVEQGTALHLMRCALLETGQVDEFRAVDERLARLVDRSGDGDMVLLELWWRAGLALARGAFDDARVLADAAVREASVASPAASDITRASRQTVEGVIAWHERDMGRLIPDVVDLASTLDADWLLVLAQAYAQSGRREEALHAVARVEQSARNGVREPAHTVLLADVLVEVGDARRAAEVLPRLEQYGDTIVTPWPGTTVLGPAALYRGTVKQMLGEDGRADLERAVELSRRFGFAPFERKALAALET